MNLLINETSPRVAEIILRHYFRTFVCPYIEGHIRPRVRPIEKIIRIPFLCRKCGYNQCEAIYYPKYLTILYKVKHTMHNNVWIYWTFDEARGARPKKAQEGSMTITGGGS